MSNTRETQTTGTSQQHQAPTHCNHTSVGMLIEREGRYLFFKRVKFPWGIAAPAGHVDELDHLGQPDEAAIFEQAAHRELEEEVGLTASTLTLIVEGVTTLYPCRRIPMDGGDQTPSCCSRHDHWHRWRMYLAHVTPGQMPQAKEDETQKLQWLDRESLRKLADRTHLYLQDQIPEEEWKAKPGLEPVWMDFLNLLQIL